MTAMGRLAAGWGLLAVGLLGAPISAAEPCGEGLPRYTTAPLARPTQAPYLSSEGRIRIVGYNDMEEMFRSLTALFSRYHPGFEFELVLKGTRTGPPALTDRSSLFAPMGAEMEDGALVAYRAVHRSDPLMIRVAHASLVPEARSSPTGIFVHTSNPLKRLSVVEARRIFASDSRRPITRWSDLGVRGPLASRAIRPIGLAETTAIGLFVRRHKFDNSPFVGAYRGMPQSRDVIEAVARDPAAIGFANLNHASPLVRALALSEVRGGNAYLGSARNLRAGHYPLDRHLLVYARREPNGRLDPIARAWLELILSCEGQRAIAAGRLGYIPLGRGELIRERRILAGR